MLGLPQTFLQDVGYDIATFDCLPEDMQIEELTILMNQQQIRGQSQAQQAQGNARQNNANNAQTGQQGNNT
jgi:hypothetical protein